MKMTKRVLSLFLTGALSLSLSLGVAAQDGSETLSDTAAASGDVVYTPEGEDSAWGLQSKAVAAEEEEAPDWETATAAWAAENPAAPADEQPTAIADAADPGQTPETAVLPEEAATDGADAEYTQDTAGFVKRMYDLVMGRTASQSEVDAWVTKLNSHETKAADFVLAFFLGSEYQGHNRTDSQMVQDAYAAMFDRSADKPGYDMWVNALAIGMTRRGVCLGFIGSGEFATLCQKYGMEVGTATADCARDQNYERTYFVYRLYANCLLRKPDVAGLENWCAALGNGTTGTSVANGFINSAEYKAYHSTNLEFVNMLYTTILGRSADPSGGQGWANKLNTSDTRESVFNGFIGSDEFKAQCAKAGIVVGTPIATQDAGDNWQTNVQALRLVNAQRTSRGLSALTLRQDLWESVAVVRVNELVQRWSLNRPNGKFWTTAFDDAGFAGYWCGETALRGYNSLAEAAASSVAGIGKIPALSEDAVLFAAAHATKPSGSRTTHYYAFDLLG